MTTLDLLTKLKALNGGISEYRVAQLLGVTRQNVSAWKRGVSYMSDEVGIRAAKLLELDPDEVVLDLHLEREKGHATYPVWESIRDRLKMAAAPAVVGFLSYGVGALNSGGLI